MHEKERRGGRPRDLGRVAVLAGLLLVSACGGGGGDDDGGGGGGGGDPVVLTFYTTNQGALGDAPVVHSGAWLAFLAAEAASGPGGSDLNGDGDTSDRVPIAVDTAMQLEYVVPAAARELALLGGELYAVVDEGSDELDWDGDGTADDRVLLHWSVDSPLQHVDTLDPAGAPSVLVAGTTLFYASASAPMSAMESSLRALAASAPRTPRAVGTTDMGGPLRPVLLAEDEGLLLLGLDEQREGRDLNGDGDDMDLRVLALLDGTGAPEPMGYPFALRSLALAGRPVVAAPFRASARGPDDWLVGLLVNELAQGAASRNDATVPANGLPTGWLPGGCTMEDTDLLDDVLCFVRFGAWVADPLSNPPVNTGFASDGRIVIAGDFVGAVCPESAQEACSLNGDGDTADRVFRWVRAESPLPVPATATELLLAVADLPGGTGGVAELSGRFVACVDEEDEDRDLDGDEVLLPGALVGWLDPAASSGWTWDHEPGEGFAYAVATWMGEVPGRERMGVAFAEESTGVDINGDGDEEDSVPTFPYFAADPLELVFPGFGVACPPENAGIVIQQGHALYRVSELLDGFDSNGDGDMDDLVLWRSRLSDGRTTVEAVLNDLERPAVEPTDTTTPAVGAFLADELHAGDLNGDGRADGLVLRYYAW